MKDNLKVEANTSTLTATSRSVETCGLEVREGVYPISTPNNVNKSFAPRDDQTTKTFVEDDKHYDGKSSSMLLDAENSASSVSVFISLDSVWFWSTQLELYRVTGLNKKIVANDAPVILHYLLNLRMVKRMRRLLISYKEDIPTLNLEDKVYCNYTGLAPAPICM
ncbi:Hypothetical predicted protein [Olea europaea subsp. europaea]|uniref:Uncharacterized protein n=1 Tax=Olea europaea subsp. europaea TaxID=158383 RepID=A0A8S0TXP2_OLEEU|nr:Hypothetical predicted protein [Olea europaea subsp. europaea]